MPTPNLLATPRFWKKKAVLIKEETAYGTDPVPTGLLNWIEARNVSLTSFDAEKADRNLVMDTMGNSGSLITSIWSKLSFEVAIAGSGAAGTAAKWGPLMLGLAFSETVSAGVSVTYNAISQNFGSLTAYLNIDGTLYKFVGSRGEVKGKLSAKGIPVLSIELTSLYSAPVEGAMPTIDKDGWLIEDAVNSVNTGALTVNGVDLAFSTFDWASGNQVSRVDLPGPQREVRIDERKPTASATVLAPALSDFDPYALARAATVVNVSNIHGTVAGKKFKTELKAAIVGVAETEVDKALAYTLTFEPKPVSGNDELTLTLL